MKWFTITVVLLMAGLTACANGPEVETVSAESNTHMLSVRNERLFVGVSVNGVATQALLDSAAEISVVDKAFAERVGLAVAGDATVKGSGGEESVSFAEDVTINAVGRDLSGLTVAVLDLTDISARLVGEPLNVILGRELFDSGRLSIDIEGGSIAFVGRNENPLGAVYGLTAQHGVEAFEVDVGRDAPVLVEFDLGNGSEVLIGAALADELGLRAPGRPVEKRTGGGIGGAIERDIVIIPALTVGGVTFKDVEAAVDELDNAAALNIGVSILKHFRITTDFPQRKIWLEPLK